MTDDMRAFKMFMISLNLASCMAFSSIFFFSAANISSNFLEIEAVLNSSTYIAFSFSTSFVIFSGVTSTGFFSLGLRFFLTGSGVTIASFASSFFSMMFSVALAISLVWLSLTGSGGVYLGLLALID
jgi:hypothetical protein